MKSTITAARMRNPMLTLDESWYKSGSGPSSFDARSMDDDARVAVEFCAAWRWRSMETSGVLGVRDGRAN
jgi:hypothetical protein